jgi:hypothetical protein
MTEAAAGTIAPPPLPERGRADDWMDRLNPIVVRETIQALSGRGFFGVLVMAAIAAALVAIVTLAESGSTRRIDALGDDTFYALLRFVVMPVVAVVLPFQAFATMRTEMQPGMSEQLFLSGLTPARVVFGRIGATAGQYVMWSCVFLPLLSTTYILRGVSFFEAVVAIVFAGYVCALHAAFATACGAFTRWRGVGALANAVAGVGVAVASVSWIVGAREIVSETTSELSRPTGPLFAALVTAFFVGAVVLLLLVAQSQLTHPFENRSTPFRLFFLGAVAACLLGDAWSRASFGGGSERWWPYVAALSFGLPFLFFPMTEEAGLSPAVRTRVPKNPVFALLMAPLLPGRGLGALFTSLATVALVAANEAFRPPTWSGGSYMFGSSERFSYYPPIAAAYLWIYGGLACVARRVLPAGAFGNWAARLGVVAALVFFCLAPLLVRVLFGSVDDLQWTPLDILNPFWTFDLATDPSRLATGTPLKFEAAIVVLALLGVLATVPAMIAGIRDVLAASRARREAA